MVVLDITVFLIGRFLVEDDWDIVEVNLYPTTSPEEFAALQEMIKLKAQSMWLRPLDVVGAALGSLWGLGPEDYTVHSEAKVEPQADNVQG